MLNVMIRAIRERNTKIRRMCKEAIQLTLDSFAKRHDEPRSQELALALRKVLVGPPQFLRHEEGACREIRQPINGSP